MNALIQAELLKLRTVRSNTFVAAGTLVLAALLGAATAATAGIDAAAPLGSAANLVNIVGVSGLPPLAALIVGVLASAGELQHRTIAQTYLTSPPRGRVLAAKAGALAITGTAVAAAVMVAALLAALPRILAEGAHLDLFDAEVVRAVGGNLLAGALFAVVGVALGFLLRNQLAAVLGAVVWALVVEGVIATVAGADAVRWFPGAAARALTHPGADLVALPTAVVLTVLYAGVLSLLAARTAAHQDIS